MGHFGLLSSTLLFPPLTIKLNVPLSKMLLLLRPEVKQVDHLSKSPSGVKLPD